MSQKITESQKSKSAGISRRDFLKSAAGGAASLALIGLTTSTGLGQNKYPEYNIKMPRDFAGEEIQVYHVAERRAEYLQEHVNEFTDMTGIKANVSLLPYPNLQEKQFIEVVQGAGPDVLGIDQVWLGQYKPYMVPINQYIDDPALTDKEALDLDDIVPTILKYQCTYPADSDTLWGFPYIGATRLIYYRTDLFEEYADDYKDETGEELKPPATWPEYMRIAKFFEENVPGVHGTTIMGRRGVQLYCDTMGILWAFGGNVVSGPNGEPVVDVTPGMKPSINSPEAIEALTYLKDLANYASPGITDWDWDEAATAFASGKAALCTQWNNAGPVFTKPEESKVIGKWAPAQEPGMIRDGKLNRYALFGGWCLGINQSSKHKEAAYLFTKWAISKAMSKKAAPGGGPARKSIFNDPELIKQFPHYPAALESYNYSRSRPRIPELSMIADIAQTAFSQILTGGKSVERSLNDAQKRLKGAIGG